MSKYRILTLLTILLLVLAACGGDDPTLTPTSEPEAAPTEEEAAEAGGVLVLADVSDNPQKVIDRATPLADYLAANLGEFGISTAEVRVASDFDTMVQWLNDGEVNLYFDSPYPVLRASNEAGAVPILRRWKDGISEYHSIFFTLGDAGYESLADLSGQMIALDEIVSTSGYLMPVAHLIDQDLNPVEKDDIEAEVAEDEIGFVFSGDDENTIQWVISGRVAAGVVDNDTFSEIPEETRDQLTILAETNPVPRQMAVVNSSMDEALVEAITELLIGLDEAEEGAEILDTFKTSQFDEFPEGPEAALENMQNLYDMVQNQ